MFHLWGRCALDASLFSLEAQRVIALRMAAFAAGGSRAQAEAQRMITEKIFAAMTVGGLMSMGSSPTKAVRHYRNRVRANARRLSRRR